MVGTSALLRARRSTNYAAFLKTDGQGVLWGFRPRCLARSAPPSARLPSSEAETWPPPRSATPPGLPGRADHVPDDVLDGPIPRFFVVYHLLHFTVGSVHPASATDVYLERRHRLLEPGRLDFLHRRHGSPSVFTSFTRRQALFQTLGLRTPKWEKPLKAVLMVSSTVIVVVTSPSRSRS